MAVVMAVVVMAVVMAALTIKKVTETT